ncbi:unnamed protein product [Cuscuta campestris]|uniref:Uncharacterized protein n=1 Tax=Cuscuta campestris TaxID=132261 RepID=A0A484MZL0_9ASTE|nr:unnamed protein product [Cuscuta campestris]
MAESLGKGFGIHDPDAVGGSVLLIIRIPRNRWSWINTRTPSLDESLALFSIGGVFPFYSVFPHPKFPVFEKDSGLYKKADFYYPLGPDPIPFEGVSSPGRSKASPTMGSPPVEDPSGDEAQGGSTTLVVCTPSVALDAVPISAIPGLRRPMPSQKQPQEGITDDDFLPKKSKGDSTLASPIPLTASSGTQAATIVVASVELELPNLDSLDREADKSPDQAPLQKPPGQSQPVENISLPTAAAPQGMEKEVGEQKEPAGQRSAATPPTINLPIRCKFTPQSYPIFKEGWAGFSRGLNSLKASHSTIQVNLEKIRGSVQDPIISQARLDLFALDVLHSMEQAQFDKLRGQISCLESKVSTLEGKEGSLKAELVERESRISELENSLHGAKQEGAHFSELMLKHMGLKREALQKLEKEKKTANELRLKVGELEKIAASHQGEVAALTTSAEALYEEGKFDMQFCIYEAIYSGLPAHRTLDDFITYYGLPLPLPPPDSRSNPGL